MSIDTSVGRVDGVRVSIDTSVQVSGQGSAVIYHHRRVRLARDAAVAWYRGETSGARRLIAETGSAPPN